MKSITKNIRNILGISCREWCRQNKVPLHLFDKVRAGTNSAVIGKGRALKVMLKKQGLWEEKIKPGRE